MANKNVRKIAVAASDVAGFKTARYERSGRAFGVIDAGAWTVGDQFTFPEIAASEIVCADIVFHSSTPVVLRVFPGTDLTNGVTLITATNASKISYVVEYRKGVAKQAGLPLVVKTAAS
jgi:hypothetical protein